MKNLVCGALVALALGAIGTAHAADAAAGKAKSTACAMCHGADGKGGSTATPTLAGQKEAYLAKATKDYRDGKRKDAMMEAAVKALSDADVANLAAYYSSLK